MKKVLIVTLVLALAFAAAAFAGCGGKTDLSKLQTQINELKDQNKQQADKIKELETEVDRANEIYDWAHPIFINATDFINLYDTNRAEFLSRYLNKVVRVKGTIVGFSAYIDANSYSQGMFSGVALILVFPKSTTELASLDGVEKTYLGVFKQEMIYPRLFDCRIA